VDWKLEVVVVPVSDLERSKAFYRDMVGFTLDHDYQATDAIRIVQLTPPGSACSIVMGLGIPMGEPGSLKGVQLVVDDVQAARAELVDRGVAVSEVVRLGEGDGGTFVFFDDPDGNTWAVQEYRGS